MSDAKVKRNDATGTQRANFLEAAVASRMGLEDAVTLLTVEALKPALSLADRNAIEVKIALLEARLAKVQDRLLSFLANRAAVRPPNAPELQAFKDLAADLDALVAQAVTVNAVLSLAGKLYSAWNQIR